jgi:hypothetical protein
MARKLLIALLIISFLVEIALCIGAFFLPTTTLKQFGVALTNDTSFLGYIVAWFLLFVSIIIIYILVNVINNTTYKTLSYLLGIWWIGIGVGIYLVFKRPDNLLIDSVKGFLLILLTWWHSKKKDISVTS